LTGPSSRFGTSVAFTTGTNAARQSQGFAPLFPSSHATGDDSGTARPVDEIGLL
jgi:hypothetical protein